MDFWKMNANGNDFILIDIRDKKIEDQKLSDLTKALCHRKKSIGADGILFVATPDPTPQAHFKMRLFNADGSEAEMCGNGARCIARYAYENGIAPQNMKFQTLAGIMQATVDGTYVDIEMGEISLIDLWLDQITQINDTPTKSAFIWAGVPHLILFPQKDFGEDRTKMTNLGRQLRHDTKMFPKGTNVTFAWPQDDAIKAATYERGVEDITDSCGTGSVATAIAANILFDLPSPIKINNPGGQNTVSFIPHPTHYHATLGGNTAVASTGKLGPDALTQN